MSLSLLLEFNELSSRLMDQFVAAGQRPNFRISHDESEISVTEAVETYPEAMDPVGHGPLRFNYVEHGVYRLGAGLQLERPCVGDLLSKHLAVHSLGAPVVGVDIDATSGYSLST